MKAPYNWRTGIVAPQAGWTPPVRYLLRRSRILALTEALPKGRLLEIGCGAGALLCDFGHQGFSGHGLETSNRALAISSELARLANCSHPLRNQPAPEWPTHFDVVCAFDVLEHIEDQDATLQQWLDMLSPEGHLVISVPAHRCRWGPGDEWAGHWRRYDRQDLLDLMQRHKLRINHIECYGFPLANTTELAGNLIYRRMIAKRGDASKAEATAASGISRKNYSRFSKLIASPPGRLSIAMADWLQKLFLRTDLGSGYLVVARRG